MQQQIRSFHDMYIAELQELHNVETQLMAALQKVAGVAQHPALKQAFETHRQETQQQRQRLEQILSRHGANPREHVDQAMQGIIREAEKMAGMLSDPAMRDAALIASAQKVEHYEICSYGTARAWAQQLGLDQCVPMIEQILHQEEATDQKLNQLAESQVNQEAASMGDGEMEKSSAKKSTASKSATSKTSTAKKTSTPRGKVSVR